MTYAKECATRMANQGHISAGSPVWLTDAIVAGATFTFREIRKNQPRTATVLTEPYEGAVEFYPSGRSAVRA